MSREATNRVYQMIEDGVLSNEGVVNMCLQFMSEADVEEMLWANDLEPEDDDEDEDEEDESCSGTHSKPTRQPRR